MGEPDADAVSGALERLLASVDFDASPRSREFLRHVVEETVAGRAAQLSQVSIARRVFKRPDDFDPGLDPIVRIQAVRLRRSLERYYLLSGDDDPVRIELPRGGYVPVLRWATPAERPIRHPTPGPEPAHDLDDWPVVVVQAFDSPAQEAGAPALLREELATELGRYQDVHVVLGGRRGDADRPAGRGATLRAGWDRPRSRWQPAGQRASRRRRRGPPDLGGRVPAGRSTRPRRASSTKPSRR